MCPSWCHTGRCSIQESLSFVGRFEPAGGNAPIQQRNVLNLRERHDLNLRFGVSCDLFGGEKAAVKSTLVL